MSDQSLKSLVIDLGSGSLKVGFAGEAAPRSVFPNVHGRPRQSESTDAKRSFYVGAEALALSDDLVFPVEHGLISHWDELSQILQHTFANELHVNPEQHSLLIADPPFNPYREKSTEFFFEQIQISSLFMSVQASLALQASGLRTGLVLDSGFGVSHIVPIFDGRVIKAGIRRFDLAGNDLTDFMLQLVNARGYHFCTASKHKIIERDLIRDIKERLGYVAQDFEAELATSSASPSTVETTYTLPDSQIITVGNERFRCAEAIFKPSILGLPPAGVHELVHHSISGCEEEMRKGLCGNILLAGGTTLISGFADRLRKELAALSPSYNVIAPPDRHLSTWIGGSSLASAPSFPQSCVSKQEYDEFGSSVIHRKCDF